MKVLIVDDSTIIRNALERIVTRDGLEIAGHASNGREALEQFERLRPDIVLLDLTMPELDGMGCLQRLLAIHPDTRVIVVSALSGMALEAVEKGARAFIKKPFDADKLRAAIQAAVK